MIKLSCMMELPFTAFVSVYGNSEFSQIRSLSLQEQYVAHFFETLRQGMFKVVNAQGGTLYSVRSSKVVFAAKSGTAQVFGKKGAQDDLSRDTTPRHKRNHGLCCGFVPFDKPEYAIAVIVEHGGSGLKAAAPVVKEVCNILFL